jgi:hypothetical protein
MVCNKLLRSKFRPRERKEHEAIKKFIMRSLKISTLRHTVYYGDQVSKCKMGKKCSIQSVIRKFEEISDGTTSRLEDNIKVEQINTM